MSDSHPRHQLNDSLMHPVRFSLAAALASSKDPLSFKNLKETLDVSDSVLSKQLSLLEQAGIVEITKSFVGKRPLTTATLSRQGTETWKSHLAALRSIAG